MFEEEITEYRVTWFPPGARDQSRTFRDEDAANVKFDYEVEEGSYPFMESRRVVVSEWQMTRNSVADRPAPTTTRSDD